jgi:hypothetical protein
MADLSFATIVQRQIRLLQHVCETLTTRALAGAQADLESLFLAQGHLEHWLQYLSPLAFEAEPLGHEAPAPLPGMRPAPPLAPMGDGVEGFTAASEEYLQPRVSFPPEPLWVNDLEHDQGDGHSDGR